MVTSQAWHRPILSLTYLEQGSHEVPTVLALGLDPACVELPDAPNLTPQLVQAFIDSQLDRLRALGYEVHSCLVAPDRAAEDLTSRLLQERSFDCVMFGAGLRAPAQLLLFERLLNVVHTQAPNARLCFNTTPADTAEAVQRWV